jgi:DNA-binding transcriptional MerR regulator
MNETRRLRIGEVAERVGLSLRSVRFYEEAGLLTPDGRTEGGFRLYTESQVERLLLIKRMKPLGFSVAQMSELLTAYDTLRNPRASREEIDAARVSADEFAAIAAEACGELRTRLALAEEFSGRLSELTSEDRTSPQL